MLNMNFKSGVVVFDEFHINFCYPYSKQLDSLSEDLIQVTYGNDYILDVGWYPEHNENGGFIIQVIKGGDWEHPIYKNYCKQKAMLIRYINRAISIVERLKIVNQ